MTTAQELAELRRRIQELENANRPTSPPSVAFERIDPTARLSMPRDAIRAMVDATPSDLLRDIVHDNRPRPQSSSMLAPEPAAKPPLNVTVERPLKPPEGIATCDRMMDVQDELDRRELARKLRG